MTIKRDTKRGYNTRVIPVQSVIHLSNSEEAKIIGTEFLILEFVEGRTFANIYELYVATLKDGRSIKHPLIECIREMGNIHNYHWICTLSQEIMKFKNSQQFWSKQVYADTNTSGCMCLPECYIYIQYIELSAGCLKYVIPAHSILKLFYYYI